MSVPAATIAKSSGPQAGEVTNTSLPEISRLLKQHDEFLILSHQRPDGDANGSQIALGLSLIELGKKVTIWNHDGLLKSLEFLPGSHLCLKPPAHPAKRSFQVVVALDCADMERLGDGIGRVSGSDLFINIDHHISNRGYGTVNHVDANSPATGEIVSRLIYENDMPMNRQIAENLFVAIATDTGSFQYGSTTAETFRTASQLVAEGLDVGRISQQLYFSYPKRRIDLLAAVLETREFFCADRVASMFLTLETMKTLGVSREDTEGLINYVRSVDSVEVAVFFEEMMDAGLRKVRVSFRSKDAEVANVSEIAGSFGGGGHMLAAGARLPGPLDEAKKRVIEKIKNELEKTSE